MYSFHHMEESPVALRAASGLWDVRSKTASPASPKALANLRKPIEWMNQRSATVCLPDGPNPKSFKCINSGSETCLIDFHDIANQAGQLEKLWRNCGNRPLKVDVGRAPFPLSIHQQLAPTKCPTDLIGYGYVIPGSSSLVESCGHCFERSLMFTHSHVP